MAKRNVVGIAGLMTDANPIAAPAGSLRLADDVVIERPGVASPRPGFGHHATKASTDHRPRSIGNYGAEVFVGSWDGAAAWEVHDDAGTAISGEAEPLQPSGSFVQFVEARDNLYWSSKKGPRKITSTSDTASEAAGMHEAPSGLPSVVSTGTPVVLPTNYAVAWRWCFRKLDASNLETRSAPSPWSLMTNNGGSTQDMSWIIPLPGYVAANDQIELYRSIAVTPYTATPSDVMFLAVKYVVTSTDVTNGYATVTDRTSATALGAELYTNPTREGALKQNDRPPASVAMARWSECMWYGSIVGPYTCALDIVTVTGSTATDGLTGLQRLQRTGDSTNASNVLTNLASTTSIKVGQLVSNGTPGSFPTGFGAPVTVTAKTSTTVTVSAAATSSNVGATYYFHDGITVDGTTYWTASSEIVSGSYPAFTVTTGDREKSTARSLAYVISRVSSGVFAYAIEDPYYRTGPGGDYTQATVVIRSRELDDAQWSVTFICDTTSSPPAVQYKASSSGNPYSTRDDLANVVMYSKASEPEHVPPLNYIAIGNERDPIYAMVPLRSALLVFKSDGVFRITGSPPDGWRVDVVDSTIRILRGECVDAIDNAAIVWADRGVFRVDEAGAVSLSAGKIDRELAAVAWWMRDGSTNYGAFVRAYRSRNLVLVGVPASSAATEAAYLYAYSVTTGEWSRWTHGAYCAGERLSDSRFFLARSGALWELRSDYTDASNTFFGHDRSYSLSGWTYTAGATTVSVSDAQRGTWTPKAGDWLSCGVDGATEYRRVTAAADAGASYTLTIASAFSGGTQSDYYAYEGIVSKMQWNPVTLPADTSFVRGIHALMDWSSYATTAEAPNESLGGPTARLLIGASTNITTAITTTAASETRAAQLIDIRAAAPRGVARATYFMPYLETDDIGIEWRCNGLAIDVESVGERTHR